MAQSEQVPETPEPAKGVIVKPGRLPVSELAADKAGGPSPFGEENTFPLPADALRYTHTTTP